MAQFELFLDDDNEIKFDVTIEGISSGSVTSKLVLETHSGFELGFDATKVMSDEIHFTVPRLKNVISEGATNARLEVFIDDRRFVPLDLVVNMKKSIKVEAAVRTRRIQKSPTVSAVLSESSASPVKKSAKKSYDLDDLINQIERK